WVATKAGFAAWYVREGNGVIEAYVFINGVAVGGGTNSNHNPPGNWNGIIAFDEGDVISRRAGNDSGIYLYYIPPKAITPPELNENYSLTEKNTGKKWLNGETIYSKTITYRTTSAINAGTNQTMGPVATVLAENVDKLITSEVVALDPGAYGPANYYAFPIVSGNLIIYNGRSGTTADNTQLMITFEYTKTTG
ncbi:MAG: hypothetical protein LBJ43_01615, partial [Propionibacteriaceae bacterium]|nr:hypothetical protein [Propionibacteriaceae bacterium]